MRETILFRKWEDEIVTSYSRGLYALAKNVRLSHRATRPRGPRARLNQ